MFRVKPLPIGNIVDKIVRDEGLATPLMERRAVEAWNSVAGELIAKVTKNKFMRNGTLFIEIQSPAIRTEVMMRRSSFIAQLNERVGGATVLNITVY